MAHYIVYTSYYCEVVDSRHVSYQGSNKNNQLHTSDTIPCLGRVTRWLNVCMHRPLHGSGQQHLSPLYLWAFFTMLLILFVLPQVLVSDTQHYDMSMTLNTSFLRPKHAKTSEKTTNLSHTSTPGLLEALDSSSRV